SNRFTTAYCGNAALTILFYDWLLCLHQEVACIWKPAGGLNAGSLVYALNRFPMIVGLVIATTTIYPSYSRWIMLHSCHFVFGSLNFFTLLSRFSSGMFSAFRVYAVSGRKVVPTLIVSLLSITTIINTIIVNGGFTTVEILPSPFNCSGFVRLSPQWTFSVMALLNVLHITLTAISLDPLGDSASYVTLFTDPISSVLTSRFILNLRQVDHRRMPSETMPSGGDIHFAPHSSSGRSTLPCFIASFGEPLHTAPVGSEVVNEAEDAGEDSGKADGLSTTRDRVDASM
ncbi:hypothetical protein V8D89_002956, partial [Ganoderma adspersum]